MYALCFSLYRVQKEHRYILCVSYFKYTFCFVSNKGKNGVGGGFGLPGEKGMKGTKGQKGDMGMTGDAGAKGSHGRIGKKYGVAYCTNSM